MPQNPEIVINSNDKVQSQYTYIQATGSTGSDGSTQGIHLRWDFRDELGEKHLPKGNPLSSYPTSSHFHKPDDFVKVFKTAYIKKYPAVVDFANKMPDRINSGSIREWEFDIPINSILNESVTTTIIIRFSNIAAYNLIASSINPLTNPFNFLSEYSQYTGSHIEVEAKNKLCFAVTLNMVYINESLPGAVKTEAISTFDNKENVISCRKTFNIDAYSGPGQPVPIVDNAVFLIPKGGIIRIEVENIQYLRFNYANVTPLQITVETYHDFIVGTNNADLNNWQDIGQFALTEDNAIAHERLEGPAGSNWGINNWPRFINGLTTNIVNYKDKWDDPLNPEDRIKNGVQSYLLNSTNLNPASNVVVPYETTSEETNDASTEVSYLNLLKLVACDFHIARMLGLGYIDEITISPDPNKYIYLLLYDTVASLGEDPAALVSHFYMTMPTSKNDACLPDTPILSHLSYGLEVPATPTPIQLTDPGGYLPYHDIRYIRLFRTIILNELPYSPVFYENPDEFCSRGKTETIFYGLDYRIQGSGSWDPGLSFDAEYNEVVPIPNHSGSCPIFTHDERNEGFHEYQIYGINWFSRPSTESNILATNETKFPIRNTLLPPSNFSVQLIQKEEPRIFTTISEQTKLQNIDPSSNDDEILVRSTFYWNHVHHMGYQFQDPSFETFKVKADKIQLFFRQNQPDSTRGIITDVISISDEKACVIVGAYNDYTQNPPVTYTPEIISGVHYTSFNSGEKTFLIDSIQDLGGIYNITIYKIVETQLTEVTIGGVGTNEFVAAKTYISPNIDDYFSLTEDISNPDNSTWPKKISNKIIDIVHFETNLKEDGTILTTPHIHTETRSGMDGQNSTLIIGGIFEKAEVAEVPDRDINNNEIPNSRTGVFKITFNGNPLIVHPQPDVYWYKGTIRINYDPDLSLNPNYNDPNSGYELDLGEKKVLEVIDIDQTGANLVLTVVDSTFEIDTSSGGYNITGSYQPILTGTNILVNFHPGYRVYFYAETGFDKPEILPAIGAGSRRSFMGANSIDLSENLESKVSSPALLLALEIIVPEPPAEPSGPIFATRPDFYGKSTYTFDTLVKHNPTRQPYSLIFYRANERSVLDTLYKSSTVDSILSAIKALSETDQLYMNDYWRGLVNANITSGQFTDIHGVFQFPVPDNDQYVIPGTTIKPFDGITSITDDLVVKNAIKGAFLPLTEQPVIYSQIEIGKQTRKSTPVFYDNEGRRLMPDDSRFDPFPMAVKYDEGDGEYWSVRFTDFTIDGASTSIFFYYAVEMTNKMMLGDPSPIAGPIHLINSFPPEPPEIRKATTILDNPVLGINASVKLEINKYLPADKISGIQIYRATNVKDAGSVRTMKLVKTIEQDLQASPPVLFTDIQEQIIDDFSDLTMPPFGDTIFYRLIALRKITNEQGLEENIPSEQSTLSLTSLVDVINPEAPILSFETGEIINPAILPAVLLKWGKTVHNGKYYLYKMNSSGNWGLIDTIITNDENIFYEIGDIIKKDEDDNTVYSRYKVSVENTSGLLNLTDKELTI
ncbi:MAG: hypothetical protein A2W91_19645 [Bacteroidetes bacterium GWF2_38_335]|nr:MAG: hypothetical protein A2W91_19645 [Bacteroidetes bacterium GWF2_38_335]OFY79970.1 MAG: hypothetical protein A2281_11045 [Bacteroidetes bacterium RIFOXYA12_FULL_38_20]HBS86430.1 hypothetical protein [Bacteroidales bacterium]